MEKHKVLREHLIIGYQVNAAANFAIAHEWQMLEEEAWVARIPLFGAKPNDDAINTTRCYIYSSLRLAQHKP
jgi:hypothetical protein